MDGRPPLCGLGAPAVGAKARRRHSKLLSFFAEFQRGPLAGSVTSTTGAAFPKTIRISVYHSLTRWRGGANKNGRLKIWGRSAAPEKCGSRASEILPALTPPDPRARGRKLRRPVVAPNFKRPNRRSEGHGGSIIWPAVAMRIQRLPRRRAYRGAPLYPARQCYWAQVPPHRTERRGAPNLMGSLRYETYVLPHRQQGRAIQIYMAVSGTGIQRSGTRDSRARKWLSHTPVQATSGGRGLKWRGAPTKFRRPRKCSSVGGRSFEWTGYCCGAPAPPPIPTISERYGAAAPLPKEAMAGRNQMNRPIVEMRYLAFLSKSRGPGGVKQNGQFSIRSPSDLAKSHGREGGANPKGPQPPYVFSFP